jgi:hypothetical protein
VSECQFAEDMKKIAIFRGVKNFSFTRKHIGVTPHELPQGILLQLP